jgi:hypothetical protein
VVFLAKKGVFDESEDFPTNLKNPEKGSKPRKRVIFALFEGFEGFENFSKKAEKLKKGSF